MSVCVRIPARQVAKCCLMSPWWFTTKKKSGWGVRTEGKKMEIFCYTLLQAVSAINVVVKLSVS